VRWNWSWPKAIGVTFPLFVVDSAFLGANLFKIPEGGWFPLVIGLGVFTLMSTWRTGRLALRDEALPRRLALSRYIRSLKTDPPRRVPGTAVYLHRRPGVVPPALLANFHTFRVLHEEMVVLNVVVSDDAHVPRARRDRIRHRDLDFHEVELTYGFADRIDVPADLQSIVDSHLNFAPEATTYFLGRETLEPGNRLWLLALRDRLFIVLHRNARNPADAFQLPADRTLGVATQLRFSDSS
jgi:KUP system potassium uptake protein